MSHLYHHVQENMKGNVLMPLNKLKKNPSIYRKASKKYIGREDLIKKKIPILNCLWNDVLHLSPVDPEKLKRAQSMTKTNLFSKKKWFKINPEVLDPKLAIIFLNPGDPNLVSDSRYYRKYRIKDLQKYNKIPKKAKEYFKKTYNKKTKRRLQFYSIPHIFYKGNLNIKNTEIIET